MSRMSQIHAELTSQAAQLGFESIEEAEANGYEIVNDGTFARLVKSEDEQDRAHESWLNEKEEAIRRLEGMLENADPDEADNLRNAIEFIKGVKDGV